jgi:hypothetical protein
VLALLPTAKQSEARMLAANTKPIKGTMYFLM